MTEDVTIDVDIGGTFTDCFVRYRDEIFTGKAETTEYDFSECFLHSIDAAIDEIDLHREALLSEADRIRYSTTVALNKLIAREGTTLGLLTTEGTEDLMYIGRGSQWADGLPVQERRNVVRANKPDPLIPRSMTLPVKERIDYKGTVVRPLDEDDLREKIQTLINRGARAFVVSLAWSFRNPVHEERVREIINEEYPDSYLGSTPVFLSSEVNPQRGEYERTMTTILNAYLHRPVVDELYDIGERLRRDGYENPLMMIHNTGGLAEVYRTAAINMFNAGPVSALIGSQHLGERYGFDNVITADMGGTSFDLSLVVQGSTRSYDIDPVIDRWRVNTAMLEAKSIGAGGGSIASVNETLDNRLEVGPESAESNPGPACYNQGGRDPTVTDADVVLGYINPDNFHGGEKQLSPRRAEQAIRRNIARPLDIDVYEAAAMIRKIVDARMGNTMYKESALRGYDPRKFVMFAFGGAGPTHAADIARTAGIDTVATFPYSSVFSAFGSSIMDSIHIYERSQDIPMIDPGTLEYFDDFAQFNGIVEDLQEQAVRDLTGEGYEAAEITFELELDMKYGGLLDVTRVRSPHLTIQDESHVENICEAFENEYKEAYSPISTNPDSGILIENFLLKGIVRTDTPDLISYESDGPDPSHARVGERDVYWTTSERFVETPVYDQSRLKPENRITGPAIVEGTSTTVSITPDATYRIDEHKTGILEVDGDR